MVVEKRDGETSHHATRRQPKLKEKVIDERERKERMQRFKMHMSTNKMCVRLIAEKRLACACRNRRRPKGAQMNIFMTSVIGKYSQLPKTTFVVLSRMLIKGTHKCIQMVPRRNIIVVDEARDVLW